MVFLAKLFTRLVQLFLEILDRLCRSNQRGLPKSVTQNFETMRRIGHRLKAHIKLKCLEDRRKQASEQRRNRGEPVVVGILEQNLSARKRAQHDGQGDKGDTVNPYFLQPRVQRGRGVVAGLLLSFALSDDFLGALFH